MANETGRAGSKSFAGREDAEMVTDRSPVQRSNL